MKNFYKYAAILVLVGLTLFLATVIEKNFHTRDEAVDEAETEVIELCSALEMKEVQRKQTQAVIDFVLDNPKIVIIEADRHQTIVNVRGDVEVLGWTRYELEGLPVSKLIETGMRSRHSAAFSRRVSEGQSGEVRSFRAVTGRTGAGKVRDFDGVVFWHHERGVAVAFLAPAR